MRKFRKFLKFLHHRMVFHWKVFRLMKFVVLGYSWLLLKALGLRLHPPKYTIENKHERFDTNRISFALKVILLPLIFSVLSFYFIHPTFAQLSDEKTRLAQYLAEGNNIVAGVDTVDGFSHAYYIFEGDKKYLSEGSLNDKQVETNGEYIVWSQETGIDSKIFLYNVLSAEKIDLSYGGTNLSPKVSRQGKVVWQAWVENPELASKGNWQLFLYDGKVIRQITQGDLSMHPDIEGDFVVYARKNKDGLWRSEAYSILEDKHADIDIGNETEYPKLAKGEISVGSPTESMKKYPLKVQDLFLVNLAPLTSGTSGSSLDAILKELDSLQTATLSGVLSAQDSSVEASASAEVSVTPSPEVISVTPTVTP